MTILAGENVSRKRMKACWGWIANRMAASDTEAFDAIGELIDRYADREFKRKQDESWDNRCNLVEDVAEATWKGR